MVKKEKHLITEEKDVVVDVICNMCTASCIPVDAAKTRIQVVNLPIKGFVYGLPETEITGGYYSYNAPTIEDCVKYTFALCERCLATLFRAFKIPPTTENYVIGE